MIRVSDGRGEGVEKYIWMMVFTGIIVVLGCVVLGIVRCVRAGWRPGVMI